MHISKWLLSIKFTEWDPLQPFMHDILEPKSINNFHTEESIKCEFDNMQRFSFTMQFDQLPNRSTHTHTQIRAFYDFVEMSKLELCSTFTLFNIHEPQYRGHSLRAHFKT